MFEGMYEPLVDGKGRRQDGEFIRDGCNVYCGMVRDELTSKSFVSLLWQKYLASKGITNPEAEANIASGVELRNFMKAFDPQITSEE